MSSAVTDPAVAGLGSRLVAVAKKVMSAAYQASSENFSGSERKSALLERLFRGLQDVPCRVLTDAHERFTELSSKPRWWVLASGLSGKKQNGTDRRLPPAIALAAGRHEERAILKNVKCAAVVSSWGFSYLALRGGGVYRGSEKLEARSSQICTVEEATVLVEKSGSSILLDGIYHAPFSAAREWMVDSFSSPPLAVTLMAEGKIHLHVDLGMRQYHSWPEFRSFFRKGNGVTCGLKPWDLAPYYLLLREAGCVVTDSQGRKLEDTPLDYVGVNNRCCVVSAVNRQLHSWAVRVLESVEDTVTHYPPRGHVIELARATMPGMFPLEYRVG